MITGLIACCAINASIAIGAYVAFASVSKAIISRIIKVVINLKLPNLRRILWALRRTNILVSDPAM